MENNLYTIEALSDFHDKKFFDCGVEFLNGYLKTLASQHQSRSISRTFVVANQKTKKVLGYYTLATGQLHHVELPSSLKHPKYPVPIVRLARLAVDLSVQKQSFGERLLHDALKRIFTISQAVGVFAVVVDAKNETAVNFYKRFGFSPLEGEPQTLFLLLKTIAALF